MRRNLDRDNVTALDRFKNATQRPPAQSDVTLSILNSSNNPIAQIIYRDSIPTALTDIQFQATGGAESFLTLSNILVALGFRQGIIEYQKRQQESKTND